MEGGIRPCRFFSVQVLAVLSGFAVAKTEQVFIGQERLASGPCRILNAPTTHFHEPLAPQPIPRSRIGKGFVQETCKNPTDPRGLLRCVPSLPSTAPGSIDSAIHPHHPEVTSALPPFSPSLPAVGTRTLMLVPRLVSLLPWADLWPY